MTAERAASWRQNVVARAFGSALGAPAANGHRQGNQRLIAYPQQPAEWPGSCLRKADPGIPDRSLEMVIFIKDYLARRCDIAADAPVRLVSAGGVCPTPAGDVHGARAPRESVRPWHAAIGIDRIDLPAPAELCVVYAEASLI